MIYNNSKKKDQTYIQNVSATLQKTELQANINKSKFYITKISYLQLFIFTKDICIDSKKVEANEN